VPNKPLVSGGGVPPAGADQTEAVHAEAVHAEAVHAEAVHADAGYMAGRLVRANHAEIVPIEVEPAAPPAAPARGKGVAPTAAGVAGGPVVPPGLAEAAGAAAGDALFPLPATAPASARRRGSPAEIAAARACPPLARARALALWVGAGRPVTTAGVLAAPAAAEAIQALGLRPPADDPELDARQEAMFAVPERDTGDQARRSAELSTVWDLALDVGFLAVGASMVRTGPALALWPDGGADAVLRVWSDALTSATRRVHDREPAPPPESLRRETLSALDPLYETESVSLAELRTGLIRRAARNGLGDELRAWTERCGDPLSPLLGCLTELGAVRLSGDRVGLTALGKWAWRTLANSARQEHTPPTA
jgi:hypothetical protein